MIGEAYAYGHLATAAFSLAMAIAFAVIAWRVPGYRADLAYAVCALLCAGTALAAMALALDPGLARARHLFSIAVALYASVPILWHVQFAADVWPPATERRHRRLLQAYAAGAAFLIVLVEAGLLDGGAFRTFQVGPVHGGLMVLPPWAALVIFGFACAMIPLSVRLLGPAGPRRVERRSALPLMLVAPPLCAHELMVAAGVHDMVPLGGYFAGLASLQGVVILAVRFRALTEPRRLGPYRIERRIGSGGMADVFLAHRTGSGPLERVVQPVALKRLRPGAGGDAEARLIEEARVLTRLSHPNIVRMLDAGVSDGEVYLALELVDGTTLARLLERAAGAGRPLGAAVAIEVGAQVTDALGHAHPAGLIHRDVTPQNVLVDATGTVKLTDFGIARALDRDRTRTGGVRGKLPYVAPEQLRGKPYDHRVDLHALGVLLHEMATGRPPYDGDSDGQLLLRIVAGERSGAAELALAAGAPLAALIDRLLAPDPADRPADAAEVAVALAGLRDATGGRAELRRHIAEVDAARDDDPPARRATRRLSGPSTPG